MKTAVRSYEQLKKDLELKYELPVSADWSAAADFLYLLKEYVQALRPEYIVECSSGVSSLILGRCCQLNQRGRVISLENAEQYAQQTKENISRFGLSGRVKVLHAPLETCKINNSEYQWYGLHQLPRNRIDMLVIDGPPGFIQKNSRFPALPLLYDLLADKSLVLLDDAARDDEKEIVSLWLDQFPDIEHQYINTERGCSVLKIHK